MDKNNAAAIPPLTAPAPLTDDCSPEQYLRNVCADVLLALRNTNRESLAVLLEGALTGLAAPAPQQSEGIHCQEFHELAMAYRSAPAFRANEPYFELVAYINNKFAKAALATVQTDRMPPIQSIHYIDGQGTRVELQILHGGPSAHGFEITVAAPVQAEQVAAVRAALKPFADLAELFDAENRGSNMPGADADPVMQWPRLHKDYVLTVGHLRAARNALAAPSTATSNDTGALGDTGGAE